jgi:multiple sugar transport system substrate-binding protein
MKLKATVNSLRARPEYLPAGLLGVVILLAGFILSACGADATPTPVQPTATPAPVNTVAGNPANPVTLTWSFWGDSTEVAINNRLRSVFEASHPGIKINILYESWNNYFDKLKNEWVGDKAPDVMFLDNVPTWAGWGLLESIEPYIQRDKLDIGDFYPGLLDAFRYHGALHGLPRDNDTKVIYVNLDMLKEAGITTPQAGWTWQDLRSAAQKLTQRDASGNITRYGFAFEPDTWWRLWVWQNGGELYDKYTAPQPPTKLLLDNKAASDAVQFFADLINKDRVTPTYDQMNSGDKIAEMFTARKVAMAFGNHTNIATYAKTPGLRWDVVPLPAGKQRVNVLGGAGYAINKNSKHKEAAWQFIEWLTGPSGEALFADTGLMVPARKSVREDNIFLRQQPYNTQVFLQETEVGKQYPEFLLSSEVDALMNTRLQPVWQGKATAADVFAKLPDEVEPIFVKARAQT